MIRRRRRRFSWLRARVTRYLSLALAFLVWAEPDFPRQILNDLLAQIHRPGSVQSAAPPATAARTLSGTASVIDGDTIDIHGIRVRLWGIDAPESGQRCTRPHGEQWRCGKDAAFALADRIGRAPVVCEVKDTDRYGRKVALCRLRGDDLNGWMVRQGWAVAYRTYSRAYVDDEAAARAARLGVWSGRFQMPWDWRKARRS